MQASTPVMGWRERWKNHARHGGKALAYALLQALLRRSHCHCRFFVHYFIAIQPGRLQVPARQPRGLEVRELGVEDVPLLDQLRPTLGMSYADRLARGHRALGVFLPSRGTPRLVGFVWITVGPALLPASFGCQWQLASSMAWIYDLYSAPEVLGAVTYLYDSLRRHPPAPALSHWVGQIYYGNWRSHWTHRSLGYQRQATLWSLHLGRWQAHLSYSRLERRWRWHRAQAAIPLPQMLAYEGKPAAEATTAAGVDASPLRLQCACGGEGACSGDSWICRLCGRQVGAVRDGFTEVGAATPYWGELAQAAMQRLLERAEVIGWRAAAAELLTPALYQYVASSQRAAFQEIVPLGESARILDVGAGWGSIAAELARRHQVVALEGVAERTRFIAMRQQQEKLERLTVVRGDIHTAPFVPNQFDAIIVNGVLEWSALYDRSASPAAVQQAFLVRLRELLRPGGFIYIGIENRYGMAMLHGAHDHSGLSYTSLLPRRLARWVCSRRARRGADVFPGYRTYTYSYGGYLRLFRRAGLQLRQSWASPLGYNAPSKLVPFDTAAIGFATGGAKRTWYAQALHRAAAHAWVRRHLVSDFVFLLQATAEAETGLRGTVQEGTHA